MKFEENKQYSRARPWLKLVRDCVAGEPTIKHHTTDYLKHPNAIDQDSPQQRKRYDAYIDGAEFHETPSETLTTMIGQMTDGEISYKFPGAIDYLAEDSDGDGMSLAGAAENVYKNVIEAGYHILLAEMSGLTGLDTSQLSIADLKEINPRATIKHYTRESLIDWDFRRINGVMQLSLMVLREINEERDLDSLKVTEREVYLVLGLDGDGNYYQQKYIKNAEGGADADGDRYYPMVGGNNLKWIPAEIVFDCEVPSGQIPEKMGYLYRICAQALYRYRASADYKEALRMIQPTTFTSGWKDGDWERFKEINEREYIAFGAGISNNLPDGVTVDIKGMGVEDEPFERYFDRNDKIVKSLGGVSVGDEETAARTATQSRIDNAKATAAMRAIVKNTERSLRRLVCYCGMYMGLWGQEAIEDNLEQITLKLPSDFGHPRMTVDEIAMAVNSGLISRAEATRLLSAAGKTIEAVDVILDEIETQGPQIGSLFGVSGQVAG